VALPVGAVGYVTVILVLVGKSVIIAAPLNPLPPLSPVIYTPVLSIPANPRALTLTSPRVSYVTVAPVGEYEPFLIMVDAKKLFETFQDVRNDAIPL
jgi:hypothetical protein